MSYPVSDEFRTVISESHQLASLAVLTDPTGAVVVPDLLLMEPSTVTVDRTAAVRRVCSVTVPVVPEIAPFLPTSANRTALDPYGNMLKLYRGVVLGDGTQELCPLGVFRIQGSALTEDENGPVLTITGSDQAKMVADAKFIAPYQIPSGTNVISAIVALVKDRLPQDPVVHQRTSTVLTTPMMVLDLNTDPWAAVMSMALSIGGEVFFDIDGSLVIQDEVNPALVQPSWVFAEGESCTITALTRQYDVESTYNGLLVTGENTQGSAPASGAAYDLDPTSPTYWFGPYGQKPTAITSPLALTNTQAGIIAETQMRSVTGLSEVITVTIVPNPSLDVSDAIQLVRALTGFNDIALIDSFILPIDTSTTETVTCRTRRVPQR